MNDGVVRAISTVRTLEDRVSQLEAQHVAMAASTLRAISSAEQRATDADMRIHACQAQIWALKTAIWVLTVLNIILLCGLILRDLS